MRKKGNNSSSSLYLKLKKKNNRWRRNRMRISMSLTRKTQCIYDFISFFRFNFYLTLFFRISVSSTKRKIKGIQTERTFDCVHTSFLVIFFGFKLCDDDNHFWPWMKWESNISAVRTTHYDKHTLMSCRSFSSFSTRCQCSPMFTKFHVYNYMCATLCTESAFWHFVSVKITTNILRLVFFLSFLISFVPIN